MDARLAPLRPVAFDRDAHPSGCGVKKRLDRAKPSASCSGDTHQPEFGSGHSPCIPDLESKRLREYVSKRVRAKWQSSNDLRQRRAMWCKLNHSSQGSREPRSYWTKTLSKKRSGRRYGIPAIPSDEGPHIEDPTGTISRRPSPPWKPWFNAAI